MKRTAGAVVLLAGLGGCASPDGGTSSSMAGKPFNTSYSGVAAPDVVGPQGEPIHMTAARGAAPAGKEKKTETKTDPMVQQSAGFARIGGGSVGGGGDCSTGNCGGIHTPGVFGRSMSAGCGPAGCGNGNGRAPYDPYAAGPMGSGLGTYLGHNGIMPVPGMGPAGAVAYVPPGGMGMGSGMPTNQRTSVKFTSPAGGKITWLGPTGYIEPGLVAPASYNFLQGGIYRLRVSGIPNRAGKTYYPTLELAGATPKTIKYLAHNTVPIGFTDDDFERANGGSMVTKVIYLPDPQFQDLAAIAGAEEVVSTQLLPGEDPVVQANRRGTILAIITIGNIDLENPFSPAMDAMPGGGGSPAMAAPAMAPTMSAPMMSVPVMSAPAMPAPGMPVPVMSAPKTMPAPSGATTLPKAPGTLPVATPTSVKK